MRNFGRHLLALILALSLPAAALAAPARAPNLGKKSDAGGPSRELAGDISRKKKDKEQTRPNLEYDKFRFNVELQLKEKRQELMSTLEQMTKLSSDQKELPDLLFRLGEIYWEESKYWFFEANRQDDALVVCKQKKDAACAKAAERQKKEFTGKSEQFQNQAIARYKELIKRYPKYERVDEVLFYLGHNLYEAGKDKEALGIYKTLITRFPKSKYLPDAYLAFGEFYFNHSNGKRNNLNKALEAYTKAASYTESKVYGFAIYKQGWCYYNLGDFAAAADKFKATIFYGDLSTNVGADNKTALVREARKDFVLAYSHFGHPSAAKDEFQKVGGPDNWWSMLKGLAGLYYDDGKDKEAVLTYRALLKEQPLSPEAPFFQGRIVDAVMRVGNKRITVEQSRLLVKKIQEVEKSGVIREEKDKQALREAKELAERTLSNLAVVWHNEGKKTRDEETFGYANEVYVDYLTIFPESKKAYDLRFFHAELLFDHMQKYEFAAEEYDRVLAIDFARMEKKKKPGKWLVKAAEGAIYAHDEVVKKLEENEPKGVAKDPTKQVPIPEPKKKLLAACENYLKLVKKGDQRVEINYKAANLYYRYNHFDEAVKRFADIALGTPSHQLAEYSANLILDVYNLLENYEKIDEWARKFYAEPRLAKGQFKKDLEKILERNAFKLIARIEKKEQFGKAGDQYFAFVKEWPKSELADAALFNASVAFHKARRVEDSIHARDRLVREYPKSKLAPQALYLNATQFEEIAEFEKAASYYETYASSFEKQRGKKGAKKKAVHRRAAKKKKAKAGAVDKGTGVYEEAKAKTALYNAGVFRDGLGQYRLALRNRELYVELWPNDADTEAIFLSIADLHEKNGKLRLALRHLEAYARKYDRVPNKELAALYRMAKIHAREGSRRALDKTYEKIWDIYRKLGPKGRASLTADPGGGLEAVAHAHYALSEPTFNEFDRIRLRLPEQVMAKRLQEKTKALLEVQKRYTETVGFKTAEPAICALYKIGLAYRGFANALYDAPIPNGLNEEQQDMYRSALAEQGAPVEAKAVEALASAVTKSREFDVYNDCSREALAILNDKASDRFPQIVEVAAAPTVPPGASKQGAGLLAAIQPIPKPPPAELAPPAVVNEKAPPAKRAAGAKAANPPAEDRPPEEPDDDRVRPSPTAPVYEAPIKKRGDGEPDDEDLL